MGHHYTPRAHLRRFKIDGSKDLIWMFDKKSKSFVQAAIGKVAQEPEFYDEDIEKGLAQDIEGPSNAVIGKILNRENLDNAERTQFSMYLVTMATRGPRLRRKAIEHAPESLKSVVIENRTQIEKWIEENGDDVELQKSRLKELEVLEEQYASQIPQHVMNLIRIPFWSPRTVEFVHKMRWHIIPAPPHAYFVTSDTPAHFFDSYGVGNQKSEFTFPISKSLALIGEHQHSWGIAYEEPDEWMVGEVNRRILSVCERFVFAPHQDPNIETMALESNPYLSRIVWQ